MGKVLSQMNTNETFLLIFVMFLFSIFGSLFISFWAKYHLKLIFIINGVLAMP